MKALRIVLILLLVWLVGCARLVVVKPEEVSTLKDTDWKVAREPVKTILERTPTEDKGEK